MNYVTLSYTHLTQYTLISNKIAYSTEKKILEENYTIFASSWREDEASYACELYLIRILRNVRLCYVISNAF